MQERRGQNVVRANIKGDGMTDEEVTIPPVNECETRQNALAMACSFAEDHMAALAIADVFIEYIEGNTSGLDRKPQDHV